ncbi:DUF2273 domain-containing protein [Anaerococcus urinomassiliensis]|uniref:DUF2273 domain-containing protein n=1 Tax=Anaerococcus urinomassiliensis TaxID=1745712 RepID=UPI0009E2CA95|nr:DUF2273 domain-containing protein [Anaerococcus urinomassiliensis]
MKNNYEKYSDYQNDYENSILKDTSEKIVIIEKKKEKADSFFIGKIKNFASSHWNEFKYTILGLVVSILFLTIGFFRTLLIIILYNIGKIYGKYKDGDPEIIFMLEKFFR